MRALRPPSPKFVALAACAFFGAAGLVFVPLLGLENDEALFGGALYHAAPWFAPRIAGVQVPLMLMSYVGALKSLLYASVFRLWEPGLYSIRAPMVVAGAATVWLFFLWLRRIAGGRVAAIGAALLATDSLYLLTTVYDWGPVALQHLFLAGGALLCARFAQSSSPGVLACGFLLFGLGLWDKALFAWILGGLVVAALAVFGRDLLRLWTWRRAALAAASLLVGALPLVLFNARSGLETLRAAGGFRPQEIPSKLGYLVASTQQGILAWLTDAAPAPLSPLGPAFLAAAVLWPLVWRIQPGSARWMLFAAAAMAVAWVQMAATPGAGASAHHTVLLWPFPQLFVALALGAAWPPAARRFATAVMVALVCWNLWVLEHCRADISRRGGGLAWNDAIHRLSDFLKTEPAAVYAADWGIQESLVLLHQGRLVVQPVWSPMPASPPGPAERRALEEAMNTPQHLFVAHAQGSEFFPGNRARLLDLARQAGLQPRSVRTVSDSQGRPRFDLLRFGAAPPVRAGSSRHGE